MNVWLAIVIIPPFLWALSNVLDAGIRRYFVKNNIALMWIWGISRVPFAIFLFFLSDFHAIPKIPAIFILLGGILWVLAAITYYQALEFEDVSRVALLLESVPLFTLGIAYVVLGETLTEMQSIGFILLMLGSVFATLKKIRNKWHVTKALWLVLFASFLWALSDVIFKKFEPDFITFITALAWYTLGSSLPGFFVPLLPSGRNLIKKCFTGIHPRGWWLIIISQIGGTLGSFVFAYALTIGKASLTAVMMGTQPLFAFFISLILCRFLREIDREDVKPTAIALKLLSLIFIIFGLFFLR